MSRFKDQSGESRLAFLMTLAAFGMLVFALVKYLPVRINAYQFREAIREEVRYASANRNDKLVAERILDQAEALDIPLDPKNLKIQRTKSRVKIRARYEQVVDFKLTTYNFVFDEEQEAPVF